MLRTSECIDWLICIPVRPRAYRVALITRLIRARPRIADKELFIERCGGRTRGCQWASLDNKRRNTRKKKPTPINRCRGILFFSSPLERRVLARIPSALDPLWRPRDIREAAKGILRDDQEGCDPPLSGALRL